MKLIIDKIFGFYQAMSSDINLACEQALSGSCGGEERKGPVGMGGIFGFHIPDLRYMAFFVIFPCN